MATSNTSKATTCTCKTCHQSVDIDEASIRAHLKSCRPAVADDIHQEYGKKLAEAKEKAA